MLNGANRAWLNLHRNLKDGLRAQWQEDEPGANQPWKDLARVFRSGRGCSKHSKQQEETGEGPHAARGAGLGTEPKEGNPTPKVEAKGFPLSLIYPLSPE